MRCRKATRNETETPFRLSFQSTHSTKRKPNRPFDLPGSPLELGCTTQTSPSSLIESSIAWKLLALLQKPREDCVR